MPPRQEGRCAVISLCGRKTRKELKTWGIIRKKKRGAQSRVPVKKD